MDVLLTIMRDLVHTQRNLSEDRAAHTLRLFGTPRCDLCTGFPCVLLRLLNTPLPTFAGIA
jgi:hypothetical protein